MQIKVFLPLPFPLPPILVSLRSPSSRVVVHELSLPSLDRQALVRCNTKENS